MLIGRCSFRSQHRTRALRSVSTYLAVLIVYASSASAVAADDHPRAGRDRNLSTSLLTAEDLQRHLRTPWVRTEGPFVATAKAAEFQVATVRTNDLEPLPNGHKRCSGEMRTIRPETLVEVAFRSSETQPVASSIRESIAKFSSDAEARQLMGLSRNFLKQWHSRDCSDLIFNDGNYTTGPVFRYKKSLGIGDDSYRATTAHALVGVVRVGNRVLTIIVSDAAARSTIDSKFPGLAKAALSRAGITLRRRAKAAG
jgi:hypothetical protein